MMASQHYGFVPPPPAPPAPQAHSQAPNRAPGPQSPAANPPSRNPGIGLRRRVNPTPPLPTITTSLSPACGSSLLSTHTAQTPSSATSAPTLSIPFSPYAPAASPLTATAPRPPLSPMALRSAATIVAPYNPSEWSRSGPVSGSYVPYQSPPPAPVRSTEITGMEAANMPSPPPPYSPTVTTPQGHNITSPVMSSAAFAPPTQTSSQSSFRDVASPINPSSALSPAGSINPWDQHRLSVVSYDSPRTGTPPAFPPPPSRNGRERSVSRNRPDGRSILSGLSALASRNRSGEQAQAPNAIDSLRYNTSEALARAPGQHQPQIGAVTSPSNYGAPDDEAVFPPSARRAASTGGIGVVGPSRRSPDNVESPMAQPGWAPGMPLPPPPACPPPSGNRSQSMSRTSDRSYSSSRESSLAAPPARRPPQRGTHLEPVPPTPADWVEHPPANHPPASVRHNRSPSGRLFVDTNVGSSARPVEPPQEEASSIVSGQTNDTSSGQLSTASASSATALSRQPAKRDPSARGIRERRSESRAARERAQEFQPSAEISNNPWAQEMDSAASTKPANLDLQSPLSRRRKPSTASAVTGDQPAQSPSKPYGELDGATQAKHRPAGSRSLTTSSHLTDTPPFSPVVEARESGSRRGSSGKSPVVPPMALPTPPQRNSSEYFRPTSNLSMHSSTGQPSSREASSVKQSEQDMFSEGSVERHRAFIEKEQAAKTDQERLELFAEFIVMESRLRRDRYSSAFDGMAGEIFDLTRDLWRSFNSGRRSTTPVATPAADGPKLTRTTTASSVDSVNNGSSPAYSAANYTPKTDLESPQSTPSQTPGRDDAPPRGGGYKPSLSPIPSMAMSTVPDEEEDSRGRSQSRWWEQSIEGGSQGRGGRKIERSKRESKYMGVPVEHLRDLENEMPTTPQTGGTPGPSSQAPPTYYGPDEYPPEKTALHDLQQQLTPKYPYWNHSAPTTPDPYKLDVSRLVTLPPPYPRHHPAVNNNHPDLAHIRTTHRFLADVSDIHEIKSRFANKLEQLREQHRAEAAARHDQMRSKIHSQVQAGTMSYADAAAAEQTFQSSEPRRMRDALQAEFDAFGADVMTPLHALLSERITKASAAIDQHRQALEASRDSNQNQAQEEGDERPELLEKLTLLKWLWEAREVLHRELFTAETERNELYKVLVVNPYFAAGNEDKAVDAEKFFAQDEKDRRGAFEKESLKRVETLMDVVEENVTRGVEDLLGAFWDIAPGLLGVVQKIPDDLRKDRPELLIPPMEFEENPSYHDHPLQYLFTLLLHAEKSAYQFIESQTNLLCLLHEVKSSVMVAGSKVMESERVQAGEAEGNVTAEMEEVRRMEEERLTIDLKDKVRIVDGQWREGLGDALGGCRERVEQYLVQTGGWDESLQE